MCPGSWSEGGKHGSTQKLHSKKGDVLPWEAQSLVKPSAYVDVINTPLSPALQGHAQSVGEPETQVFSFCR